MKPFRLNQRDFEISFYKKETLNTHPFMPYRMLHSHLVKYLWEEKIKESGWISETPCLSVLSYGWAVRAFAGVCDILPSCKLQVLQFLLLDMLLLHGTAEHYCARHQRDNNDSIAWLASHKTGWCLFKFLPRMKASLVQKIFSYMNSNQKGKRAHLRNSQPMRLKMRLNQPSEGQRWGVKSFPKKTHLNILLPFFRKTLFL